MIRAVPSSAGRVELQPRGQRHLAARELGEGLAHGSDGVAHRQGPADIGRGEVEQREGHGWAIHPADGCGDISAP